MTDRSASARVAPSRRSLSPLLAGSSRQQTLRRGGAREIQSTSPEVTLESSSPPASASNARAASRFTAPPTRRFHANDVIIDQWQQRMSHDEVITDQSQQRMSHDALTALLGGHWGRSVKQKGQNNNIFIAVILINIIDWSWSLWGEKTKIKRKPINNQVAKCKEMRLS